MRQLITFVIALLITFITVTVANAATAQEVTTITKVTQTTVKKPMPVKLVKHKLVKYKTVNVIYPCHRHKHYKHKRHHVTNYGIRTIYQPGYCEEDSCTDEGMVCYPSAYYQCRTEYYYHSGRNTARVEVCN